MKGALCCVFVVALFIAVAAASAKEDQLVLTPFGYMPRACVHGIGSDAHVLADDPLGLGLLRVRRNDSKVYAYPPCPTTDHLKTRQVKMGQRDPADGPVLTNEPGYPSGWAAYSLYQNGDVFTDYTGQWNVPANPAQRDLQTLFLFTGFQNQYFDEKRSPEAIISIIQPVLQFGPSAAGGGNYWAIASWYVTSTGQAVHSTLVQVNPGDLIVGTMSLTDKHWFIDTKDQNLNKHTSINIDTQVTELWAFVTLEVYSISNCGQYPNGAVSFSNLVLKDSAGKVVPRWQVQAQGGCGEAVTVVDPSVVKIIF